MRRAREDPVSGWTTRCGIVGWNMKTGRLFNATFGTVTMNEVGVAVGLAPRRSPRAVVLSSLAGPFEWSRQWNQIDGASVEAGRPLLSFITGHRLILRSREVGDVMVVLRTAPQLQVAADLVRTRGIEVLPVLVPRDRDLRPPPVSWGPKS